MHKQKARFVSGFLFDKYLVLFFIQGKTVFLLYVFLPCGFSASHVAFLLILFQNNCNFAIERRIDMFQTLGHILVYG